ncbi:hypothetical protein [Parahaliea mediterranea]|uniref:DUF2946 domain-containing protein n=1 Tax=Parahaliea mediterranea TaxID=651086 RepID=A0A939DEL1_9GAMM|nr:hypothetical protein [Parahaliea mediterranea]MBN7796808.1 hypothetical protein [Parahaliea mediterranea]
MPQLFSFCLLIATLCWGGVTVAADEGLSPLAGSGSTVLAGDTTGCEPEPDRDNPCCPSLFPAAVLPACSSAAWRGLPASAHAASAVLAHGIRAPPQRPVTA